MQFFLELGIEAILFKKALSYQTTIIVVVVNIFYWDENLPRLKTGVLSTAIKTTVEVHKNKEKVNESKKEHPW